MMLIAEKAPAATPINIGHDHEVTMKELFQLICKVVGRNPGAIYDTSKPDGYPRRAADTTLLRQYTGFVPAISLEDGLREMHHWFLSMSPALKPAS
jgi:GDP-L-fucose synthase